MITQQVQNQIKATTVFVLHSFNMSDSSKPPLCSSSRFSSPFPLSSKFEEANLFSF